MKPYSAPTRTGHRATDSGNAWRNATSKRAKHSARQHAKREILIEVKDLETVSDEDIEEYEHREWLFNYKEWLDILDPCQVVAWDIGRMPKEAKDMYNTHERVGDNEIDWDYNAWEDDIWYQNEPYHKFVADVLNPSCCYNCGEDKALHGKDNKRPNEVEIVEALKQVSRTNEAHMQDMEREIDSRGKKIKDLEARLEAAERVKCEAMELIVDMATHIRKWARKEAKA